MIKRRKRNIVLIIIIIVLLVVCIGMGVFIFLNKEKLEEKTPPEIVENNNNQKDITKPEDNEDKELDIDDTLVDSLYKMTRSEFDKCGYERQPLLLVNIGDKITPANMEDNYKGNIIFDYVTKKQEITEDEMKQAYEKVFGPNTYTVINKINFNAVGNINYDSANKKYVLDFDPNKEVGCVTHLYNDEKILSVKKEESSIMITTAYVFNCSFSTELCKDSSGNEHLGINLGVNEKEEETKKFIDEHKDELHQLTYTFKQASDGNYYYSEVERTK